MKRLGSSDSLGGLMSICPNSTDESNNNPIYTRDFQTMLEGLDEEGCCIEESGHVSEKKRRLSVDQVKALEKNFEVENKLEPERKVKLAQELGLQPRQVAVWFQNRRARWKTKQLERDYGILKANYDGLKLNFEKLQHDNEALLKEIQELKSSLNEDGSSESKLSETEEKSKLEDTKCDEEAKELNFQSFNCNNNGEIKDGSSDSDSSAIWNEDHNNNNKVPVNISFQFCAEANRVHEADNNYQPQLVKIEEHNFFGEESCCTFFSDDQAPTLHWYTSDEWN